MHVKSVVLQLKAIGFDPITWNDVDGSIDLSELVSVQVPAHGGLVICKASTDGKFSMSSPYKDLMSLRHALISALA